MNRSIKTLCYLFVLFLCLFSLRAQAEKPLVLDSQVLEIGLENNLEIYRDTSNKLTLQDILTPELQQQFKPYNFVKGSDRYSIPKVTSWIKFTVHNQYDYKMAFILKGWLNIGNLFLYEPNRLGQYIRLPSEGYIYWSRLIMLDPQQTKTFYMSSYSDKRSIFPLVLYQFSDYDEFIELEFLFSGIFFGIAVGLILYNAFIYISTKDKNYLLYIITWIAFILYKLIEGNILTRAVWPTMSAQVNWALYNFFVVMATCFYLAYINSVIKAKQYTPRLYKVSRLMFILLPLTYVIYIYSGGVEPFHLYYLVMASVVLLVSTIIVVVSVIQGYRPARYLLIGTVVLMVGGIFETISEMLMPRYYLIKFILLLANAIEMIFQSFALADRYNLIQENESKVRKELINSQSVHIKEQGQTINSYERFLPKQVLPLFRKENFIEMNLADSVETNLTVLFSDIRNFTKMAELMSPQESFKFINAYLHHMAPLILKEKGIIDKYIGDAIMALFTDTDAAIRGALAMLAAVEDFNKETSYALVKTGIAIHHGRLILGIIGSKDRMECTVISDAVNVAARLESINKFYGTSLLITDIALEKCQTPERYYKRVLDKVRFYGKNEANLIYEIIGDEHYLFDKKAIDIMSDFEEGVFLYQQKDILAAMKCFKKCFSKHPDDQPSLIYLDRCAHFLATGVPKNWDGVHDLEKIF